MSRGPLRAPAEAGEPTMGERCRRCERPREEHRLLTVHVCYSDKVIKHWMCPERAVNGDPHDRPAEPPGFDQ